MRSGFVRRGVVQEDRYNNLAQQECLEERSSPVLFRGPLASRAVRGATLTYGGSDDDADRSPVGQTDTTTK